jgi:hypothetical protein
MLFQPVRRRCKNCRKFFEAQKENQVFHDAKCRADFHNYGKTPQQQMIARLTRYMKTPAFKAVLVEAIRKELRAMREKVPTREPSAIPE